ncbi:MAG TPA: nickel-type superoxide dismutase maturation protease [Acidimicrobiales bacterium]|nr:nickel-type superoxide dismutase maturation protease [Acidimicrobiales bacterium]
MSDLSGLTRQSIRGVLAMTAGGALVIAFGCRRVVVRGASMLPALRPGDRLLLVPPWRLKPGQVVALRDPRQPKRLLVKRMADIDRSSGTVTVRGDNPGASTDSAVFGAVPLGSVVGRAVYRYAPPDRAGPLP